jgi:hypothetical protein
MNPEAKALIAAYKSGQLPVDRFLQGMNRLGYSDSAATSALVDYEVETQRAARAQGATQTEPSATPTQPAPAQTAATPQPEPVPTPVPAPQQNNVPYYGADDVPVGNASNFIQPGSDAQRFRPQYDPGQAQRFRPEPAPAQTAVNVARSVMSPQREASNTQATNGGPSALAALIRGRFGEAAQGNPMDDRLTAFQEARDRSGEARASGGEVSAKAPNNRDAALHKALEIIQHLLTRS